VLLHHLLAALDAVGADAGGDVLLEALAEGAALAAVERQHRGVGGDAGERGRDHLAGDALGLRVARHRGEEGVEVAAALRGARGRRGGEQENEGGEETRHHAGAF
jgi:hypothetical protein